MLKSLLTLVAAVSCGLAAFAFASVVMNKPESPLANSPEQVGHVKTLVVYHADRCPACRMLEKTLADPSVKAALAADSIMVQSLDIDYTRTGVWNFEGNSIPAYALMDGKRVLRVNRGYMPPAEFKRWLAGGW